ncbi:DUF192 domain-containing protein [Orrella sp. NBD-18]|uniref:DUF192 domain-containing protein n=2 Tax=Sheuella amnicola TaxID=2707330 RepID=A0A6B2QUX9_9BURK|nr:DUF192 domain-containing protein [Sheuella amnicola]
MRRIFALLWQRSLLVALFIFMLSGLLSGKQAFSQPLPIKTLTSGMHLIQAEVAATDASRTRGLMFRKELAPNHGMLFVFEQPNIQCFWMRNTLLPLSIAFINDDGVITNIADMQPMTENSHCSTAPVRYTLEMEQGWFAKRGIKAGSKITGIR